MGVRICTYRFCRSRIALGHEFYHFRRALPGLHWVSIPWIFCVPDPYIPSALFHLNSSPFVLFIVFSTIGICTPEVEEPCLSSNPGTLIKLLDKACLKKQKWGNYSYQWLSTYWTSSFIPCTSYHYLSKSNHMFLLLNKLVQIIAVSADHHDELTIPWSAICSQGLWVPTGVCCYLRMSTKGRFTWAMGSLSSQVIYF